MFGTNPIKNSPTSDAITILTAAFGECNSGHHECSWKPDTSDHESAKPCLPTRIIDVSPESDEMFVRIVESQGVRDDYAALSHCWGPPSKRPLITTKATLSQHLDRLMMTQLPKTFCDAIAMTRALSLRYLWIDSLCIIQDDEKDWSSEAPRMGQLYRDAALVIAATGARDSTQGCFLDRNLPQDSIDIPYVTETGLLEGYIQLNTMPLHEEQSAPLFELLGRRGWVVQEWALARRIVHCTSRGLMWQCQTTGGHVICEDGRPKSGTKVQNWDDVIDTFTRCDLTYPTDKLAAVEGIAQVMQRSRSDRYTSGIWTGDFPHQLFWVARDTKRPAEQKIFPSWSWASTEGPCVSLFPERIPLSRITAACEISVKSMAILSISSKSSPCMIKKVNISLAETMQLPPFIRFTSMCSVRSLQYLLLNPKTSVHIINPSTRSLIGYAIMDDVTDVGEGDDVCTSLLLMKEMVDTADLDRKEYIYLALLLKGPHKDRGTYQRIGVGLIVDGNIFQENDESHLDIV